MRDDCDRERRGVDSHEESKRALGALAAAVRILWWEHQLPEPSLSVHELHTRCEGYKCEARGACSRVPRENLTRSDCYTPHAPK